MFSQELISYTPFILGLGTVILSTCWWILRRPPGVPPGPFHVPIVGNNVISSSRNIKIFADLQTKYGEIFSMYLGNKLLVILNNYKLVKEAFVSSGMDCAGRPLNSIRQNISNFYNHEGTGIIFGNPTDEWKRQRNTALNILRSLGWGKHTIEDRIQEECAVVEKHFRSANGEPINPGQFISISVSNIICSMLFGRRYDYVDEEFVSFNKAIDGMFVGVEKSSAVMYVPWLQPFLRETNAQRISNAKHLADFYLKKMNEAKANMKSGISDDNNDFVTLYIKETMKNGKDSKITQDWAVQLIGEFFVAGSDTTASMIKWALLFMANYPHVQSQVQQELDEVFGKGPQNIRLSDRSKLPFTNATLCEIQRRGNVAPFAVPHEAMKDVIISGYNIPKGTEIWANLYNVHHDETIWPEPYKFQPQRFLDSDGELVKKEELIPFSMGRRSCLGEQLARQEMFLFFTHILKAFEISLPEGHSGLDEEGVLGLLLKPKNYEVCFIPR